MSFKDSKILANYHQGCHVDNTNWIHSYRYELVAYHFNQSLFILLWK